MNKKITAICFGLAFALLLSGCQNAEPDTSNTSDAVLEQRIISIPELEQTDDRFILTVDASNLALENDSVILTSNNGDFNINGWALNPAYNDSLSSIYIKVGDYVAQGTYGLSRPDVAKVFDNFECTYSGFNISIPVSELFKDEENTYDEIEIIGVSHDLKNLFAPVKYRIVYGEIPDDPEPEVVLPADATDLPELESSDGTINVCVDLCNDKGVGIGGNIVIEQEDTTVDISGWALNETYDNSLSALYVKLGDKVFQADYGGERPDVADVYGAEGSGFSIRISASDFYDEGNIVEQLEFIGISADGTYLSAPLGYSVVLQS